jgi:hypothetical protein
MTKSSCIEHLSKKAMVMIREDYVEICTKAPDAKCAAALLNLFEYWTNIKLAGINQAKKHNDVREEDGLDRNQDESLWIWKATNDLHTELMTLWGTTKIETARKWLVEQGLIHQRRNPDYSWDKTYQYKMDIEAVNLRLRELKNKPAIPEITIKSLKDSPAALGGDEKTTSLPDGYRELNCLDCEKILSGGDEVNLVSGEGNDYRVRCNSCQEKIDQANTGASAVQETPALTIGEFVGNLDCGPLMGARDNVPGVNDADVDAHINKHFGHCTESEKALLKERIAWNVPLTGKDLEWAEELAKEYGLGNGKIAYTKLHKSALAATEVNGYCRSAPHNVGVIDELVSWGLLKKSGKKYIATEKGRKERTGFTIDHDAEYIQMIADLRAYNDKQEIAKTKPKTKKKKSKTNDLDLSTKPEIAEITRVLCLEYFKQPYDQLKDAVKLTAIKAAWKWRNQGADTAEKVREVIGHYAGEDWSVQLTIHSLTNNGRIPQALGSIVASRNKPEEREFNIGEMK